MSLKQDYLSTKEKNRIKEKQIYLKLEQPRRVTIEDLVFDLLSDSDRIHDHRGNKVQEDVVAVGLLGHRVRESHLELVQSLEQQTLAFVLEVFEGSLGGDEVRVPDDGADEEAEVANFAIACHLQQEGAMLIKTLIHAAAL